MSELFQTSRDHHQQAGGARITIIILVASEIHLDAAG
jgi:hypothetical protein